MSNIFTLFAADTTVSATEVTASVCKCVDTSFFGRVCSTGEGTEIFVILSIVVQIFTACIGTLAVIGIVYFGVQYLTTGDDPGKVKKAKSRLLAIVIGLASYAVIYSALYFLLPNFDPKLSTDFQTCTESEPGTESPITPSPPSTPLEPGDEDEPEIGDRSPYCGPENPGTYGKLENVQNKRKKDGSTTGSRVTRKYTTLNGRVFYIFKQGNSVWGNKTLEASKRKGTVAKRGCKATSMAIVLRGFGVDITPDDIRKSYNINKYLNAAHLTQLQISNSVSESVALERIWDTLEDGGAAIIRFKDKYTNSSSHYVALIDHKIENGVRKVYMANPAGTGNSGSGYGWTNINDFVGHVFVGGEKGFLYKPDSELKQINCKIVGY